MYHYTLFSKDDNQRIDRIYDMSPTYMFCNFVGDKPESSGPGGIKFGSLNHLFALDLDSGEKVENLDELNLPFEISFNGKVIFDSKRIIVDRLIKEKLIDNLAFAGIIGNNIMN